MTSLAQRLLEGGENSLLHQYLLPMDAREVELMLTLLKNRKIATAAPVLKPQIATQIISIDISCFGSEEWMKAWYANNWDAMVEIGKAVKATEANRKDDFIDIIDNFGFRCYETGRYRFYREFPLAGYKHGKVYINLLYSTTF